MDEPEQAPRLRRARHALSRRPRVARSRVSPRARPPRATPLGLPSCGGGRATSSGRRRLRAARLPSPLLRRPPRRGTSRPMRTPRSPSSPRRDRAGARGACESCSGKSVAARRRRFAAAGMSAACECALACGREMPCGPVAELATVIVERSEVGEIVVRLLEVVPEKLVVLGLAVSLAVDALSPVRETLVQRCARPLQNSVVSRVADEDVVEPELGLLVDSQLGVEQLFVDEGRRGAPRALPAPAPATSASRAARSKTSPITAAGSITARCSALNWSSRAVSSALIVGGTARSSTRRSAASQCPLTRRRWPSSISIEISCSTKSGFPSAPAIDPLPDVRRELRAEDVLDHPGALVVGQRLQLARSRTRSSPGAARAGRGERRRAARSALRSRSSRGARSGR